MPISDIFDSFDTPAKSGGTPPPAKVVATPTPAKTAPVKSTGIDSVFSSFDSGTPAQKEAPVVAPPAPKPSILSKSLNLLQHAPDILATTELSGVTGALNFAGSLGKSIVYGGNTIKGTLQNGISDAFHTLFGGEQGRLQSAENFGLDVQNVAGNLGSGALKLAGDATSLLFSGLGNVGLRIAHAVTGKKEDGTFIGDLAQGYGDIQKINPLTGLAETVTKDTNDVASMRKGENHILTALADKGIASKTADAFANWADKYSTQVNDGLVEIGRKNGLSDETIKNSEFTGQAIGQIAPLVIGAYLTDGALRFSPLSDEVRSKVVTAIMTGTENSMNTQQVFEDNQKAGVSLKDSYERAHNFAVDNFLKGYAINRFSGIFNLGDEAIANTASKLGKLSILDRAKDFGLKTLGFTKTAGGEGLEELTDQLQQNQSTEGKDIAEGVSDSFYMGVIGGTFAPSIHKISTLFNTPEGQKTLTANKDAVLEKVSQAIPDEDKAKEVTSKLITGETLTDQEKKDLTNGFLADPETQLVATPVAGDPAYEALKHDITTLADSGTPLVDIKAQLEKTTPLTSSQQDTLIGQIVSDHKTTSEQVVDGVPNSLPKSITSELSPEQQKVAIPLFEAQKEKYQSLEAEIATTPHTSDKYGVLLNNLVQIEDSVIREATKEVNPKDIPQEVAPQVKESPKPETISKKIETPELPKTSRKAPEVSHETPEAEQDWEDNFAPKAEQLFNEIQKVKEQLKSAKKAEQPALQKKLKELQKQDSENETKFIEKWTQTSKKMETAKKAVEKVTSKNTKDVNKNAEKKAQARSILDYYSSTVNDMTGRRLMKYVSKTTGQLPEITGKPTMKALKDNKTVVKNSEFGQRGDLIIQGLFPYSEGSKVGIEEAQQAVDEYRKAKEHLTELEAEYKKGNYDAIAPEAEMYKEVQRLTTRLLNKLEGKTTVSKQFISDLTNSPDLKQVEKDLVRSVLETEGDKVDVPQFISKVQAELLPLKVKSSDSYKPMATTYNDPNAMVSEGDFTPKYENVALPDEVRGKVASYKENIYESPIKTSAGDVHFQYHTNNYFGHTRIEDMADGETRRVIEVQSDLYQKGNLDTEMEGYKVGDTVTLKDGSTRTIDSGLMKDDSGSFYLTKEGGSIFENQIVKGKKQSQQLAQYNDPTAHFRMIREEIRQASLDGKTKLQFPTGETAMNIEGLGEASRWIDGETSLPLSDSKVDLKEGSVVNNGRDNWVVTAVLENGNFKAVPAHEITIRNTDGSEFTTTYEEATPEQKTEIEKNSNEEFSTKGKFDTSNPIFKFYEKEVARYLKKYDGKEITDSKGVTWIEVPITPEQGTQPVEAFKTIQDNAGNFNDNGEFVADIKKRFGIEFPFYLVDSIIVRDPALTKKLVVEERNKEAWGVTLDNAIAVVKDAIEGTSKHEVVHLTLANIDNIPVLKERGFTRESILQAQAVEMGMPVSRWSSTVVEEKLAQNFESYQKGTYTPKGIIARFFEALKQALRNLSTLITKTDGNIIRDYYDTLLYTQAVNQEVIQLESTGKLSSYFAGSVVDFNQEPLFKLRDKEDHPLVIRPLNDLAELATKQDQLEETLIEKKARMTELASALEERTNETVKELGFDNADQAKAEIKQYLTERVSTKEIAKDMTGIRRDLAVLRKSSKEMRERSRDLERRIRLNKKRVDDIYRGITIGAREEGKTLTKEFNATVKDKVRAGIKEKFAESVRNQRSGEYLQNKFDMLKRRQAIRYVQEATGITDSNLNKIMGTRPIEALSDEEFQSMLDKIILGANVLHEKDLLRMDIESIIVAKQLNKYDNLRIAMGLPTFSTMNAKQLTEFRDAIKKYQFGDTFLTARELDTSARTRYGEIKTERELIEKAKEIQAIDESSDLSKIGGKGSDIWLNSAQLSERNAFYKWLVENKMQAKIREVNQVLPFRARLDKLTRDARKSRKASSVGESIWDSIAPTDDEVFNAIETNDYSRLTPEEKVLAEAVVDMFKEKYNKLVLNFPDFKSRENYITHMSRGFFETLKDTKSLKEAWNAMKDDQKERENMLEILSGQTGEILAFDKYLTYMMKRSGEMTPSHNVSRIALTYFQATTRKEELDKFIPEAMLTLHAYRVLTGETQEGLPLRPALDKFTKQFLNDAKGRKLDITGFETGSKADRFLSAYIAWTSLKYIGGNVTLAIFNLAGDLITLGATTTTKQKILGLVRMFQQNNAKEVVRALVGETPLADLLDTQHGIIQKAIPALMTMMKSTSYLANEMAVRGLLTSEEFHKGIVSDKRILEIAQAMNRFKVTDTYGHSLVGRTTVARGALQFKSWAVPTFLTTAHHIRSMADAIQNRTWDVSKKRDAIELARIAVLGGLAHILVQAILGAFTDDEKKNSYLLTQVANNIDSIYGILAFPFDKTKYAPALWGEFSKNLDLLSQIFSGTLDKNGHYTAIATFKSIVTPTGILRVFTPATLKKTGLTKANERVYGIVEHTATLGFSSAESKAIVAKLNKDDRKVYDDLKKKYFNNSQDPSIVNRNLEELISAYADAFTIDPANAMKALLTDEKLGQVEGNLVELSRFKGQNYKSALGSQAYKLSRMQEMGIPVSKEKDYKLEHIVPVDAGGDNSDGNLVPILNAEHDSYTPVDILMGKALKSGLKTRIEVTAIAKKLKVDKTISVADAKAMLQD